MFTRIITVFVLVFLLFLNSSSLINAQSCSGSFSCYQKICSTTGTRCATSTQVSCGPGNLGTCIEQYTESWPCVYCSDGPFAGGCSLTCGGHMTTNCDRITNGCVGPTYPPPPNPTPSSSTEPEPTAQPGWQGCGSCDTCGYGASECVTDPEGNCLWDPTLCRYVPPPCYPSCNPLCGQDDGCGGTCANTDDGAPATPVFFIPSVSSGEMIQANSSGQIRISWSPRGKAEYYRLELHPTLNPLDSPATYHNVYATGYSFTPTARYYSARIRSVNTSCGTDASAWSPYIDFQVAVPVTGHIYYDLGATAAISGDVCVSPATDTTTETGQITVIGGDGAGYINSSLASGENYLLNLPFSTAGENNMYINIENSDLWLCSCPSGCTYPSGISAPSADVNFYVLDATDPWFQAEGGPVAAYGDTGVVIQSLVSPYCQLPDCEPSMIKNQNGSTTDGYVLTGGGDIDTSFVADRQEDQIDENRHNWFAKLTDTPNQQDYAYFAKLLRLPLEPESDFGATATNASKPTGEVINDGAKTYYHNGDLTIGNNWDVAADETIIVLVDGNLSVAAQTSVAEGGFLMIVTSGNITFSSDLGHDDLAETSAVVEGVFVANGQIITPSRGEAAGGDRKFVGEGTFVGWNGFSLERDYDDGVARRRMNNTNPVEYFRYRPDFLKNAPDDIKRPQYSWREINP